MRFSKFKSKLLIQGAAVSRQARQHWIDITIAVALILAAGFASYMGAQSVDSIIVDKQTNDVWFSSDLPRVFANMTDRWSNHFRSKVHPLFSLTTYPLVAIVKAALHVQPIAAVRIVIAAIASLWISTFFVVLRIVGCRRFDATLLSILAATSAAAVFWFVIPETYSISSVSMLIGLGFVALAQHRKFSPIWYAIVSALTLSFTVTNWMIGLLVTFLNHRRKRFLQITANALCLVVLLWSVEKLFFPSAQFFIGDREEQKYLFVKESGGPLHVITAFLFHTMVMPALQVNDRLKRTDWELMTIQTSLPGSGSIWGIIAVILWTALLGLGLWALFTIEQNRQLRIVLGVTLIGQLALHIVYGDETFLYALHFIPLLVILVALSTLTKARLLALILVGMLILTTGINNGLQFNKVVSFLHEQGSPRHQVQAQIKLHPESKWPRSMGHVVLATPGSQEADKAYHEPGGSFSPAVGSFGVSLWLIDKAGNLVTTSDTIPIDKISQQLVWTSDRDIPGILNETNYYQTLWSSSRQNNWTLNLKPQANTNTKSVIVIRSVGPAGGAIQSLDWNGKRLLINDRWSVTIDPMPIGVYLGEEGKKEWMTERSSITKWKGDRGWGYARIELGDRSNWKALISDSNSTPINGLSVANTKSALDINLPDPQFAASLNAQVAHMMMGIVDLQTRPADPLNYPLTWLRDGAYEIVALARAGQLQTAKELSIYLAENDFFGGFGAEADAPGLAIWTLEEVAAQLHNPEYDRQIWPHIRRKAEFILEMLSTPRTIYRLVDDPIITKWKQKPQPSLIAERSRDGLIIGRMDNHRPLLFVNGVSYRGLLDAASLADRVKQPELAKRWRDRAVQLQQSWEKAFKPPESKNDRTYISALWPTGVAAARQDTLLQNLQQRWTQLRDPRGGFRKTPLWTYFDIAEAHQWLFLGQPERVWATLHWYWEHQASPGLYTWWEGDGGEDPHQRWDRVRGWVYPPHITPHYWTAAEMLLLQLDMLAYIDITANQPTLAIGAGIPAAWLNQPMSVRGISMPNCQVDWNWDGKKMQVKIRGAKVDVRLGSVFPPGTLLNIEYTKPL